MKIDNVNAITSSQYAFRVFDYENQRGGGEGAGTALVTKIQFAPLLDKQTVQMLGEGKTEFDTRDLSQLEDAAVAEVLNGIFKRYQNYSVKTRDGELVYMNAVSLHVKEFTEKGVFLFVYGKFIAEETTGLSP